MQFESMFRVDQFTSVLTAGTLEKKPNKRMGRTGANGQLGELVMQPREHRSRQVRAGTIAYVSTGAYTGATGKFPRWPGLYALAASVDELLYRDAFGQITRLIDVATSPHCDVIGEQLQRNHFEKR